MNTKRVAEALNTLSVAFGELAEAVLDTPESLPASATGTGAAPRGVSAPPEPSPFEDETPTWEPPDTLPAEPALSERDRVLAECPVHFTPWKVKEAGISRNGKPYSAFWKCNGKNDDGSYCSKKPEPGWVKAHDPEKALAAA